MLRRIAIPFALPLLALLPLGLGLLDLAPSPGTGTQATGPHAGPNVVLLVIDTLRADHLGAYGDERDPSPELDALARAGVRFERVIAQATWTRPSIASLVTSRYPRTLGIYEERDEILPDAFATLAEVFDARGYSTIGVTANPNVNSYFNFHQGFDHYTDTEVVFDWMQPGEGEKERGKDGWLPRARDVFDRALAEARRRPGPYYLQLDVMEVHEFYDDSVAYGAPYDDLFPEVQGPGRRYLQAIRLVSAEVDRFVRKLASLPEWEDTLFVITSDHGETIDDHPRLASPKWHGWLVYESHARVPLILYHSGGALPAGRVVERPVRLVDVMPTVLELAGVEAPPGLVGRSLAPLLAEPAGEVDLPEAFVVETGLRGADKIAAYSHASGWKYVENRDGHRGTSPTELQPMDRSEDGADTDRATSYPGIASQLANELAAWEAAHPRASPTPPTAPASGELVEQLRSLGYVE